MAADNEPAEAALRANTLRITAAELAQRLPVETEPAGEDGLIVLEPFDAHAAPEWREGLFMPQSRAAMAVARVLAPRARRARARPVRRPRRQDHPSRRADERRR